MEQYWLPKRMDCDNLDKCLNNYFAEHLQIRLAASKQSLVKVDENLEGKKLSVVKNGTGLHLLLDNSELFHFYLKYYKKGLSIVYERYDKNGGLLVMPRGINPNDPKLPEPTHSILRHDVDNHVMESTFKGKIPLIPYTWKGKTYSDFWTIP